MASLTWRIYYGDGSHFDNLNGPPERAPARNVQVIVQRDLLAGPEEIGRRILAGFDYYWFDTEAGGWAGGDLFGLFDYLLRSTRVKFGRTIDDRAFKGVKERALDDPDFPPKSGWRERGNRRV